MRIQHNISALNAHRQLGFNQSNNAKNLEKLSSGFRINRAGDDAAGLAISEKMRGQIRGLAQAQSNSRDGISLIQTAEGGLNETHSILQRMRELAVQSSNGTLQNEVDRENIDKEVNALKSEIDRIASSTHYNKINLLDGSLGGSSSTKGVAANLELSNMAKANSAYKYTDAVKGVYTSGTAIANQTAFVNGDKISYTLNYLDENDKEGSIQFDFTFDAANKKLVAADGSKYDITVSTTGACSITGADFAKAIQSEFEDTEIGKTFDVTGAATPVFTAKVGGTDQYKITGGSLSTVKKGVYANTTLSFTTTAAPSNGFESVDTSALKIFDGTDATKDIFTINGQQFAFAKNADSARLLGDDVNVVITGGTAPDATAASSMSALINQKTGLATDVTNTDDINLKAGAGTTTAGNGGLVFQIGANGSKDQQVSLSVGDMSSKGLGVSGISVKDIITANKAIDVIDSAINSVSGTRADLGALQNRLEHTVNNLAVTEENLTASESRIRDVDMAKEMMDFTKNNILNQASQAMLAQANQQPQGVLQLLQ